MSEPKVTRARLAEILRLIGDANQAVYSLESHDHASDRRQRLYSVAFDSFDAAAKLVREMMDDEGQPMISRSSQLVRAVDGVWVRPCDVTSVAAVKGEAGVLQARKPFVRITRDSPGPDGFVCSHEMLLPCESDAEAEALADLIGARVASLQADDTGEPSDG